VSRPSLSFVYDAGPCQRSLSPARVPWDSRPYFTVSDLRLPFLSPPTTLRVKVEVTDTNTYCDIIIEEGAVTRTRQRNNSLQLGNDSQLRRFNSFRDPRLLPSLASAYLKSQSYVTTDGQSATVFVSSPHLGPNTRLFTVKTAAGLMMWGALSDERPGLSLTAAAGHASAVILESESRGTHHHILLSQIGNSLNLEGRSLYLYPAVSGWPSYSPRNWVPSSSPHTTRRATVDVDSGLSQSQSHIATDGRSVSQTVSLGVKPNLGLMTRYLLLFDSYSLVIVGRPL
jgi:hypothetical protein